MMTARPEPLTPESCDLRGLSYMPLFGHHLFASDFNASSSWAGWQAMSASRPSSTASEVES